MESVPRYDTDRFTVMDRWHSVQCAAHVEFLDEVVSKDDARDWEFDGASCMANWLVNRYQVSRSTATDWVRVAHAIQELPALRAAYAAGRMSWDQLRSVTRIATPATDEELAAEAPFLSTRDLNKRARELSIGEVEEVHRDRKITWHFDEKSPMLRFSGSMVDSDGVEFVKTLTRMASQAPPSEDGTYEPFEARCLDALLQLASQHRGADSDPDRTTAVIHIPLAALTDGGAGSETEEGRSLLTETARRLVCDARIEINIEDETGTVVEVGRATRKLPAWLVRIIHKRDKGCRFPGCGRTRWIHIHHIWHWGLGGPSDPWNLISLCPYHHRLVHEGGWNIVGDANEEVTWIRPEGTPFIPGERYQSACSRGVPMLDDALVPDRFKTPENRAPQWVDTS